MNDGDDKNKQNQDVEDGSTLWDEAIADVNPLKENLSKPRHFDENRGKKLLKVRVEPVDSVKMPVNPSKSRGNEVDRRSLERLRRGEMKIEGRIDLHGLNQDRAHMRLNDFILKSYNQGKRCVLVITGKGTRANVAAQAHWTDKERGILKKQVPQWLLMDPIAPFVLQSTISRPKDGGEGALYVLLRRRRD